MLFNSKFFLYVFLPVLLLLFYLSVIGCKGRIKLGNVIILLFSMMFYICTGGWCILIHWNYAKGALNDIPEDVGLVVVEAIESIYYRLDDPVGQLLVEK